MYPLPDIPSEKRKDIIEHLERYKENIMNKSSLSTQDPNKVLAIRALLSNKGSSIISFIRGSSSFVKDNNDTSLNELLAYLNNIITEPLTDQGQGQGQGPDPRYSTLICDDVDKLFIQFPFTPTLYHINNLTKSND